MANGVQDQECYHVSGVDITGEKCIMVLIPIANKRHSPSVGLMLGQRRRRWTNIEQTMGECLFLLGLLYGNPASTQNTSTQYWCDVGTA